MRQFFRMLLLALVLLMVALVSALTAMRIAIHGREGAIPKLVGMTPPEAQRAVAALGLDVVVNVGGRPLGSVTVALQDAGIKVGKVSVVPAAPPADVLAAPAPPVPAPPPGAASMIVTQSPGPGQKVVAGGTVSFEVR